MKQTACGRAIRQFYRTTTLHGFKYLCSKYYADRVGWVVCCCASACCAGVLCAVLWARFLQVPALLTTHELRLRNVDVHLPLVAVCPAAEIIANNFLNVTKLSVSGMERLPPILARVLRRKRATPDQLAVLDAVLTGLNASLQQFLFEHTPSCRYMIRNCRWHTTTMPCFELFQKELTQWGVCCVMRPSRILVKHTFLAKLHTTRRLYLGMQCSNDSLFNNCDFYTKYEHEEWVEPAPLTPGRSYFAQLAFEFVADGDESLVGRSCNSQYSRSHCLLKCTESFCGCVDPLRLESPTSQREKNLKFCSIGKLNCLRNIVDNSSCVCLPPCKKISSYMALESSPINELNNTFNRIYDGINVTKGVTLSIELRISSSRSFNVSPTETWITLLSSLGGVFNMFLGVGLFSALEVLYLIFIKLPIACRRHGELLELPSTTKHLNNSKF